MKPIVGNPIPAADMATTVVAMHVVPKQPWKTKALSKGKSGVSTPGKTKGPLCQTDSVKKFFLTHPHAWKHPQYGIWCAMVRGWVYGKKAAAT